MSDNDSVIELTEDVQELSSEDVEHLGESIEGLPDLSKIKFLCPTCNAQEPPQDSDVHFIDKPEAITMKQPKFEMKTGIYKAGFKKLVIPLICDFGHRHTLTFDVKFAYNLGV